MSTTRITDNDYADVALYDKVNMIANEIDNEVSKKANSSNTVTTDTAQTITAVKTFTQDIKRTIDLDVTTAPASNTYKVPFQVLNSDGTLRYFEQISHLTNGALRQTCGLQRTINGTKIGTGTILEVDANGNKSVLIDVTPATTSNNQQIATTAWVNTFCKTTNKIVTEWSGNNSNSWYRKWSNGFIEQGGIVTGSVSGNNYNVSKTFYKPFTSMPCLTVTYLSTQGSGYNITKSVTKTGFSFTATSTANNYQNNSNGVAYYACGF